MMSGEIFPMEILLVEDSAEDLELIQHVLREAGFNGKLWTARDGVEALEYLLGDEGMALAKPSIILLDLRLPRIDGWEVLRRLRKDARTCCIPVVLLIGSNEEIPVEMEKAAEFNSALLKPGDVKTFQSMLRELGPTGGDLLPPPSAQP
jgi:CheY-like chemotaxis protein